MTSACHRGDMLQLLALSLALLSAADSAATTAPAEAQTPPAAPVEPMAAPPQPAAVEPSSRVTLPAHLKLDAGLGKGVALSSDDGAFNLSARARVQLRAEGSADPAAADPAHRFAPLFTVRRARLALKGGFFHDKLRWNLQLGFSPADMEADLAYILRDFWVEWQAPVGLQLRMGQMKVPFDRHRMTSSSSLQFADRTRTMSELTLDRDIGATLSHPNLVENGVLLAQLGVFGGDGRNRPTPDIGLLWVARAQLAPFGKFDDLIEGDVERLDKLRAAFAVAAGYNTRSKRPKSTTGNTVVTATGDGPLDYAHATADALFKWRGASLLVELLGRYALSDAGQTGVARSAVGGFVQGGYFFIDTIEGVGRLAFTEPFYVDGMPKNDPTLVREVEGAIGVNHMPFGHDIKIQSELGAVYTEAATRGIGRVQLQVYF